MTHNSMAVIAEAFIATKWAVHTSRKYVESFEALKEFSDEEVIQAVRHLRGLLARNCISVEEIITQIRRASRPKAFKRYSDAADQDAAKSDRASMLADLKATPVDTIRKAVTMCRASGVLNNSPLPPRLEEWGSLSIGVVHAAIQRMSEGHREADNSLSPPRGGGSDYLHGAGHDA